MRPLQEKVILVTGAAKGIGEACAGRFAQLGARIVVNDIDAVGAEACAAAIRDGGGEAIAVPADIADWAAAGALIDACRDTYGRIDGLMNNAALFAIGRLDEYAPGPLERLLAVNVLGTMHCAAHAAKVMLAQGTGSIVNVTSGAHMGIAAMGAYGATKGAVASLTYAWAIELRERGIRVNCISPMAQTAMGQVTTRYYKERGRMDPPETFVLPSANCDVAAFLLSDESASINGQIVRIEGEQLSLVAHPAVALPPMHRSGGWDYASVRTAFDDLGGRQAPLGIIGANVAGYGPASLMWAAAETADA